MTLSHRLVLRRLVPIIPGRLTTLSHCIFVRYPEAGLSAERTLARPLLSVKLNAIGCTSGVCFLPLQKALFSLFLDLKTSWLISLVSTVLSLPRILSLRFFGEFAIISERGFLPWILQ